MKKQYILAFAIFAVGVVTACQQASPQSINSNSRAKASPAAKSTADDAKRITLAETKTAYDAGKVLLVDTRPEDAYKREHIKSAINIPAGSVDQHYSELPKDKQIVFYCSCPAEQTSLRAVLIAKEKGLTNTAALLGGTDAWKNAGYPMEGEYEEIRKDDAKKSMPKR